MLVLILMIFSKVSLADNHDQKKEELVEQVKEITKELEDEDEVPLNDPFAGNEGTNSMAGVPEEEQEDEYDEEEEGE